MSIRLSSSMPALALAVALIAGCATSYSPAGLNPGDGADAIAQKLGQPTAMK